jgi:hypothetical protein
MRSSELKSIYLWPSVKEPYWILGSRASVKVNPVRSILPGPKHGCNLTESIPRARAWIICGKA